MISVEAVVAARALVPSRSANMSKATLAVTPADAKLPASNSWVEAVGAPERMDH